jgi:hypothetical protein
MSHSQIKLKHTENKKDVKNQLVEEKPLEGAPSYRDFFGRNVRGYYKGVTQSRQEFVKRHHELQLALLELETWLNQPKRDRLRTVSLSDKINLVFPA